MPRISSGKLQELRELLDAIEPDDDPEIIEEITEEAEEIAEEAIEEAVESGESAPVIEELIDIEEAVEEIAEETNESAIEDAVEFSGDSVDSAETAIDATGGITIDSEEPDPFSESQPVSADFIHADEPPRTTHWFYRAFGGR